MNYYIHTMGVYGCFIQDCIKKVAKFLRVKNQAPCKRFLIIIHTHPHIPSNGLLQAICAAKLINYHEFSTRLRLKNI